MANEEAKDEDLKVTEAEDGSVTVGEAPAEKTEEKDDERLSSSDSEHPDDEEGHSEETAEEAEARRQRNRQRRAENKDRRKDYIESLKREIAARDELLNNALQRIDAVEKRGQGADFAALDNEIKKTADAYNYFKNQIDLGTREQNGAVVADATEKMIQAQQRYSQLTNAKKMALQRQKQVQTQPAPLDPRLKANADEWLSKNPWYDVEAKDDDSAIVKAIDDRLAKEGWNPSTEAYWKELDSRVKKYLPHRANSGYNSQRGTKSPVASSGRDAPAGKGQGGYKLSAERVQALKDAGIYEDPKALAEAIQRYKDFDKQKSA